MLCPRCVPGSEMSGRHEIQVETLGNEVSVTRPTTTLDIDPERSDAA